LPFESAAEFDKANEHLLLLSSLQALSGPAIFHHNTWVGRQTLLNTGFSSETPVRRYSRDAAGPPRGADFEQLLKTGQRKATEG
jgi:hypothetical protein